MFYAIIFSVLGIALVVIVLSRRGRRADRRSIRHPTTRRAPGTRRTPRRAATSARSASGAERSHDTTAASGTDLAVACSVPSAPLRQACNAS